MDDRKAMISIYAKELKLPGFVRYVQVLREAEQNGWGHEEFLARMMRNEINSRRENQRKQRIKQAKFPLLKTLDTFEFANVPSINPASIWQLAECDFIERKENIILMGNPGTGKTHLATGLGAAACNKGYKVRFYTAAGLVNELLEAQEQRRLSRFEKQLSKFQLLILDELSYLTFSRPSAELLFQTLSTRNERGSLIVTTNLEFSRWTEIFGDAMLTAATVDRMTHRSHVIDTNGSSFRLKQRLARSDDFAGQGHSKNQPKEGGEHQTQSANQIATSN